MLAINRKRLMLQRDYFLRVIEEFAKALTAFLEKKEDERKRDHALHDLYRQYVGPYEDLRNLSFEETLQYADDQWSAAERLERLDMLANLLYAEGGYKGRALSSLLYEKALKLFMYVQANKVGEFNIERQNKIQEIKKRIGG